MTNQFRAVARQSYVDRGMPRVGREVIGNYATRQEAEDACRAFVESRGERFRAAYDDCIIELILEAEACSGSAPSSPAMTNPVAR